MSCLNKMKWTMERLITVNPRFKPRGLNNFVVHNHLGSNRERGQIETINLLNLVIWMGKLTQV